MTIAKSYNDWAENYDITENKTRDLEKKAAIKTLSKKSYSTIIELGCGTGKNTEWLAEKAKKLISLDFSTEMLKIAREKIKASNVEFKEMDLTKPWYLKDNVADLITCSLTLEHIENLDFIFSEGFKKLKPNGLFYLGELHPFKQYTGSKARFEKDNKLIALEVFAHHISDYLNAAANNRFRLSELNEWFDDDDKTGIPRLISFVFQKNG